MSTATTTSTASSFRDPGGDRSHFGARRRVLVLLLGLAWVRVLVYVFLVPPWQHYDEPTHFEYVRLIAERGRLPVEGEYDLAMRREIAASMDALGFWDRLSVPPPDLLSDVPPGIGVSELRHPPLYYLALALPQFLVANHPVEIQLYFARFCSSLLYPLLVAATCGVAAEVAPRRRWFPLAAAALVALLPPLADLASGVNNDMGAMAAATLLLWVAVRVMARGPSAGLVAALVVLAAACVGIKSTAALVAGITLLVVALHSIPERVRRPGWVGVIILLVGLLFAACAPQGQAAWWYGDEPVGAPGRVKVDSEIGEWALVLSVGLAHPRRLFQELQVEQGQALRGRPVTVGAWLRGNVPGSRVVIEVDSGERAERRAVEPGDTWAFSALSTYLPGDGRGLKVSFWMVPDETLAGGAVQIDGVVLVEGAFPTDTAPVLANSSAADGSWAGTPFVNLLRNGSAEEGRLALRGWAADSHLLYAPLEWVAQSLLEWPRTGWVYGPELGALFQSFWGTFGWGSVALPGGWFTLLGVVMAAGALGGSIRMGRWVRAGAGPPCRRWMVGLLGLVTLAIWGTTVARIHPVFVTDQILYWPVARYATVAIAPTVIFLLGGLEVWVLGRWRRRQGVLAAAAYAALLGMVVLDQVAIWWVIVPYYYG